MRKVGILGVSVAASFAPTFAFAHSGHGEVSGFMHGLAHPVGGLDHVLAMVLVGIFAWQLGGRALFVLPASFVLLMAVGGGLGIAGIGMRFVETGIALSIVAAGLGVALRINAPVAGAAALAGLFAIFHGQAHGAEMPAAAAGIGYALGFLLATALLHIAGMALAGVLSRFGSPQGGLTVRFAGAAAAVMGVGVLAGVL
jgi:urease accessory protein